MTANLKKGVEHCGLKANRKFCALASSGAVPNACLRNVHQGVLSDYKGEVQVNVRA